jgi:hypothetical protein
MDTFLHDFSNTTALVIGADFFLPFILLPLLLLGAVVIADLSSNWRS